MTAPVERDRFVVDEPGLYDDFPEDVYHADPVFARSLSASGSKALLTSPAKFHWQRENPKAPSRAMELGTLAHRQVIGVGQEPVIVLKEVKVKGEDPQRVFAGDYMTVSAQAHRDEIRAAGKLPILSHELAQVIAMEAALREHREASALLDPSRGRAEVSAFWVDAWFGIWRRARFDWLPDPVDGVIEIVDYKTAANAQPAVLGKVVADRDYHLSAAWYIEAVQTLTGLEATFTWIFQEKEPPYEVVVARPDPHMLASGFERCAAAVKLYADCSESGIWPGYTDSAVTLSLPAWYGR